MYLRKKIIEFLTMSDITYKVEDESTDCFFTINQANGIKLYLDIRNDIVEVSLNKSIFYFEIDEYENQNDLLDILYQLIKGNYKIKKLFYRSKLIKKTILIGDKVAINIYKSVFYKTLKSFIPNSIRSELDVF